METVHPENSERSNKGSGTMPTPEAPDAHGSPPDKASNPRRSDALDSSRTSTDEMDINKIKKITTPEFLAAFTPSERSPTFYDCIINGDLTVLDLCAIIRQMDPLSRGQALEDLILVLDWLAFKYEEWRGAIDQLVEDVGGKGKDAATPKLIQDLLVELSTYSADTHTPPQRDRATEKLSRALKVWQDEEVKASLNGLRESDKCVPPRYGAGWFDAVRQWAEATSAHGAVPAQFGDMMLMSTTVAIARLHDFQRSPHGPGQRRFAYITVTDLTKGLEIWKEGYPDCMWEEEELSISGLDTSMREDGFLEPLDESATGTIHPQECEAFRNQTERAKHRARNAVLRIQNISRGVRGVSTTPSKRKKPSKEKNTPRKREKKTHKTYTELGAQVESSRKEANGEADEAGEAEGDQVDEGDDSLKEGSPGFAQDLEGREAEGGFPTGHDHPRLDGDHNNASTNLEVAPVDNYSDDEHEPGSSPPEGGEVPHPQMPSSSFQVHGNTDGASKATGAGAKATTIQPARSPPISRAVPSMEPTAQEHGIEDQQREGVNEIRSMGVISNTNDSKPVTGHGATQSASSVPATPGPPRFTPEQALAAANAMRGHLTNPVWVENVKAKSLRNKQSLWNSWKKVRQALAEQGQPPADLDDISYDFEEVLDLPEKGSDFYYYNDTDDESQSESPISGTKHPRPKSQESQPDERTPTSKTSTHTSLSKDRNESDGIVEGSDDRSERGGKDAEDRRNNAGPLIEHNFGGGHHGTTSMSNVESQRNESDRKDAVIASLGAQLEAKDKKIASLGVQLEAKNEEIESLRAELEAKNEEIESLRENLKITDDELIKLKQTVAPTKNTAWAGGILDKLRGKK